MKGKTGNVSICHTHVPVSHRVSAFKERVERVNYIYSIVQLETDAEKVVPEQGKEDRLTYTLYTRIKGREQRPVKKRVNLRIKFSYKVVTAKSWLIHVADSTTPREAADHIVKILAAHG